MRGKKKIWKNQQPFPIFVTWNDTGNHFFQNLLILILNLGCAFGFLRLNKYCSENQSCKRTNKDELKWECLSPWITQQAVSICCIFCAGGNMQMQQWESETAKGIYTNLFKKGERYGSKCFNKRWIRSCNVR